MGGQAEVTSTASDARKITRVSDAPIPPDLVALKRAVLRAQDALRHATDETREALRREEREAVLALYRHPDKARVHWRRLLEAARADDQPPE